MNYPMILLILGMALVTYIPRVLPAFVINNLKFSPKVEKFLRLIPYTAMSALIFPGILNVDKNRLEIGIVGGLVACVLACFKMPVIVCVVGAILVNTAIYFFIP